MTAATCTPTKTLTVNPAFLQEIKDSNPELWENVRRLERVCQTVQPPHDHVRQLTRTLDDLRDGLALQFSLEESYGYMDVNQSPDEIVSELACKSHAQHCSLYLRLSELAEQAEELQYRGVESAQLIQLVDAVREFDSQLREHEQIENELIERCFHFR